MTLLLVALGGALGAVLRFGTDAEIKSRFRGGLPLGTFLINVVGSFVLGAVSAAGWLAAAVAFVGTGICGGFTTFSTASVESVTLFRSRSAAVAFAYAAGTLIACCLACALGGAV